jgi:hypothetical protein
MKIRNATKKKKIFLIESRVWVSSGTGWTFLFSFLNKTNQQQKEKSMKKKRKKKEQNQILLQIVVFPFLYVFL